ncbi:hypothetical protein BOX15_Mlig027477g3 [Macrostomum lignano]|uniref:Multivesicular body subunit 12B n=2 Tax=Macrostomum lignano TaxID=282301 RepID=A0A1I8I2K0_9PLAT|nr:hypothetical protein BOX15_Mlig032840g6 [Macrostomum lignano]PAA71193.1 hypothetical protein BOX15_Mlig027477g3 [Macrostomum lignano]
MANITDLKIVTDPNKAPPKYSPITQTHDSREDADLWKDGFLSRRVTRYLCVSYQDSDQVLCDLAVCNGPMDVPDQFTIIETTCDTQEKALKKKQLAVKMQRKSEATSAINDIILLGKQKRPPAGYAVIGEFNSFTLCVKNGPVEQQKSQSQQQRGAGVQQINVQPQRPPPSRQPSKIRDPLSGIPFELSRRWGGNASSEAATIGGFNLNEIVIKSPEQIEAEYAYRFSLERQVCEQSLMEG